MPFDPKNPTAAKVWALSNLRGQKTNKATGWPIGLHRIVYEHTYNHAKGNLEKFRVVELLPQLIESAVPLEMNLPYAGNQKGVIQSHIFYAPFDMDGVGRVARIVVHEMEQPSDPRHRAYDLKSVEIEKAPSALRGHGVKTASDLAKRSQMEASNASEMTVGELAQIVKQLWPTANRWGDVPADSAPNAAPQDQPAPASRGSAASPGAASQSAYPGPDAFTHVPADDPSFSQLPMELPELVQFYRALSGGQYPKVVDKIRALKGKALGVYRYKKGAPESGSIELRADIFRLVSETERNQLLAQATEWAEYQKKIYPDIDTKAAAQGQFERLVKEREEQALKENPRQALAVLAHEVGHYVDALPDGTLARGNLLGHIAALKKHLKGFLPKHPGMDPRPENITPKDRQNIRREAEAQMRKEVGEVVMTIMREEPVMRDIPVRPDDITNILKNLGRNEFPQLYEWFQGLDRPDKVMVLRTAMRGAVDPRAAQFPRQEPTGETRKVEETITAHGRKPTAAEIQKRFEELLREEIQRRGLISELDMRREAAEVIKWWQGVDRVPEYFRTATETWAEVYSAIINNPAGVAKRAPTLWNAFNDYLGERPAAAKAYRKMQDSIASGQHMRDRVMNLRDMWHRDEDASLLLDSQHSKTNWRTLVDSLDIMFNRTSGPIQRRALRQLRKNPDDPVAAAALSGLKRYLYRATGWESFARQLNMRVETPLAAASLNHDDMSEYLFQSRIAQGDRQQLANPLGFSPKTSAERLAEMEAQMGPERWTALQTAAREFREIYQDSVVPLLREADVLTPEMMQLIEDRTLYATFGKNRVFDPTEASTIEGLIKSSYGSDVGSKIYRQIGTLGEIRSPYLATVQKAFSLISMAHRQIATKGIVRYMETYEPQHIAPARERFVNDRWEPVPMETAQVGTLYTLDNGKVKAYYVPRTIAETIAHASPIEARIVGAAHSVLAWPKAILTELNPGFWPVAFFKDVGTLAWQLPKGVGALKHIPAAFQAARASTTGKPSRLADEALRRQMIISRADNRGEHLGHADELTRILRRMGQHPHMWNSESAKIGRFLRVWQGWKSQGQILERTIKMAGMRHMDEAFPDMPEWEKKRMVNELAGSPDFLEKGRTAPVVDLAMMFYNPWLRGIEAGVTSARRDPRGFWTKFASTVGLAAVAYWAFEQGHFNGGMSPEEAEDKRDMMHAIPERDKRRGFALPLWWSDKEQGKVAYIVLPFPDTMRMLHTGLRTMLQSSGNAPAAGEGMQSFLSYQGQDLPGTNPMLDEATKWWTYHVLGRNPYDDFLGRGALPEDMVTSRTGGTELALQSLSNVTGGIVYRHRPDKPGETPTDMERFLRLPVVGNLLGRWLRVSNRGWDEQAQSDTAVVRQREAELRLIGQEMVAREIRGEPWSPSQMELYSSEPYLALYMQNRQLAILQQATEPEIRAYQNAKSEGERVALLEAWDRRTKEREKRLSK